MSPAIWPAILWQYGRPYGNNGRPYLILPAILPATTMVWPAILPRPYLSCRPYLQPQLDRSAIINACKSFDLLGNPVQPAKHEPYLNQSAIISKECKLPSSRTTCHPLRGERSTGAGWGRHDEHVASSCSQWHPSPRPLHSLLAFPPLALRSIILLIDSNSNSGWQWEII